MKRVSGPRKTVKLSESINEQLSMYALAASAAGVSLLALPQQADAKIIYTPAHEVISAKGPHTLNLDLNHDGIVDFQVSYASGTDGAWLVVYPYVSGDRVWATAKFGWASALRAGVRIGPNPPPVKRPKGGFFMEGVSWISTQYLTDGNWANVKN
jgi:hypothetical protein